MATINPSQDYDIIHTLTYASSGGTAPIRLHRGSAASFAGTVYYRAGTSGAWTTLAVSGGSTTFPITSTTMQIAHNWDKSGNDYMTPDFRSGRMTGIAISQKAALSGVMGNYFMYHYVYDCSNLTTLEVPDTSGLTSVGNYFMQSYADGCSNLTTLATPDTSGLTSVGAFFIYSYAFNCSSLTALDVPDTSGLTSVGAYFMYSYAQSCSSLTTLAIPDTSGLTSAGSNFMDYCAANCSSLTQLTLPKAGWFKTNDVDWSVPSGRLGILKGEVLDGADLADWQALTVSGKTLYINYIRSASDVIGGSAPANNAKFMPFFM